MRLVLWFICGPIRRGLGTIVGIAEHQYRCRFAHGPGRAGLKGFGKLGGSQRLCRMPPPEFFGTFAVPSLTHQDPRYFRQPNKPFRKRASLRSQSQLHLAAATDGHTIPNYGVFATYPIVAELGNLYIPASRATVRPLPNESSPDTHWIPSTTSSTSFYLTLCQSYSCPHHLLPANPE